MSNLSITSPVDRLLIVRQREPRGVLAAADAHAQLQLVLPRLQRGKGMVHDALGDAEQQRKKADSER